MERRDNYAIASERARELFTEYDHPALAKKLGAELDGSFLYVTMLSEPYRVHRTTGDVSRFVGDGWAEANSFEEVLALMDLVCDSQPDRVPSGRFRGMGDFGRGFHRSLLERRDPWAQRFESDPKAFAHACEALGGEKYPLGDVAYTIEVFDGLRVLVQLWFGDEEFPAQLHWLWDENALQYLKYETMYYAVNLLLRRIDEKINDVAGGESH